jgi:hypothetical protein
MTPAWNAGPTLDFCARCGKSLPRELDRFLLGGSTYCAACTPSWRGRANARAILPPERASEPRPAAQLADSGQLHPSILEDLLGRERLIIAFLRGQAIPWGPCTKFPGRRWACHRRIGGKWPMENWCSNCLGWLALGLAVEMQRAGLRPRR